MLDLSTMFTLCLSGILGLSVYICMEFILKENIFYFYGKK